VLWGALAGKLKRPGLVFAGLAIALAGGVVLLDLGYPGQVSMEPMSRRYLFSSALKNLARAMPALRLPLPDSYIAGLDALSLITQNFKPVFAAGQVHTNSVWWYFPLA